MSKSSDKLNETNKELLGLIELQRESADISQSSLDSLKEALGIQQRRSTAEQDLLKTGNQLNRAIQDQQVGLQDISSIQKQISKNQKLINKGKLTEKGLESSLSDISKKKVNTTLELANSYSDIRSQISKQIEALSQGKEIDVERLNLLKQSEKSIAASLDYATSQLSSLEQQSVSIKVQNTELEKQNKLRQAELEAEKKIEKRLGVVGGILKGINKIPILGDVFDASEATKKMKDHLREGGSNAGALAKGVANIAKQMKDGMWNTSNLISGAFGLMVSLFKDMDAGAGTFAKTQNVSYQEALATKEEMQDIALATGDAAIRSKGLMESQMAVSKAIGTNAKLNKADLVTMTAMVKKMGMTHDEAMGIQKMSLLNGKSLKQNTKEVIGAAKVQASKNGLVVNEKDILKEVSKASAALTLSLGNQPKELAKAVVQAKQFGLSLEQADKIASGLLNFEQSITNELEAELLLGKDLNFETARQLALNNDIAGAAAEVARQVGTSADFAKMNRIQQEATAKAAGLNREELAQSLIDREALAKMSGKEGQSAQERYNEMRANGATEAEMAEELGDAKLAAMYEQQSVQEKFNDSMMELKEMLANELMPIFMGMADFLREHMDLIKPLVKAFLTIKGISMALNALSTVRSTLLNKELMLQVKNRAASIGNFLVGVGKYAANAAASAAMTPIIGPVLAVAALAAAFAGGYALKSKFSKGDDMLSPGKSDGGYGNRTLLGPEGAIQLNNKDTVIAGTNLFGDDTVSEPGKPIEMGGKGEIKIQNDKKGNGDMSSVISAINTLSGNLNAIASRPINVSIDGNKIITATTGQRPNETGEAVRKNSFEVQ